MPVGFQVQINDEAPIRAGDEHISVLSAILSYVSARNELELSVGGLIASEALPIENVSWLDRDLEIGDRIVLTIVDAHELDAPVSRTQEDPALREQQERRYYERLKARFERG